MKEKIDPQSWLLLMALTLIWGTSYILMKKALIVFSPIQVGALRITVAGMVCLPFLKKQSTIYPGRNLAKYFSWEL